MAPLGFEPVRTSFLTVNGGYGWSKAFFLFYMTRSQPLMVQQWSCLRLFLVSYIHTLHIFFFLFLAHCLEKMIYRLYSIMNARGGFEEQLF
jgi:hypothetical protein